MATVYHKYLGKDGKMPKPTPQEAKRAAAEHKANSELAKERAEGLRVRRMQAQLILAKARGELVSKEMAQTQAGFLVSALRARITAIPQSYARRLLDISEFETMSRLLKEMATSILHDIENLPRVVEEGWVDRGEDGTAGEPQK